MNELLKTLKESTLFCNIPSDVIREKIIPNGWIRNYSKSSHIFMKMDKVDKLGIILSGQVHLNHIFDDGSYTITNSIEKSDILGADLIFTKTKISPHYAVAATPAEIFFIPDSLFQKNGPLPEQYQFEILTRLLNMISQENMKKEYRLAILYQKGLRGRILTYLTMQADKKGSNTITIPFCREELASFLCVNRTALSHELSKMEADGIIKFRKNQFTLLNRGGME